MLHTLSHLLITAVALDCGYAASSIRERIYVGDAGYGILLYTASPDAEGTLGGLVEAADRIDLYLRQALDLGGCARTIRSARSTSPTAGRKTGCCGCGVPRLRAAARELLRAAQRLPRSRAGRADRRRSGAAFFEWTTDR